MAQEFERGWDESRLATWVRQLPPSESPLRLAALLELAKIDLRRRWQAGKPRPAEEYLREHRELLSSREVVLSFLQHEFEIRRDAGSPARVSDYVRRYPKLAADLTKRLEAAEAARTPPSPATEQPSPQTLTQDAPPSAPGPLPEQFGRYRILRPLGTGRHGRGLPGPGHAARPPGRPQGAALRAPTTAPSCSNASTARPAPPPRLQHPNLCPVYDVGEVDGTPYLTMAYVEGQSLARLCRRRDDADVAQAGGDDRPQARPGPARGAHARGIIHRDLKPANVMLDGQGRADRHGLRPGPADRRRGRRG